MIIASCLASVQVAAASSCSLKDRLQHLGPPPYTGLQLGKAGTAPASAASSTCNIPVIRCPFFVYPLFVCHVWCMVVLASITVKSSASEQL
jgi:hypothetical protein